MKRFASLLASLLLLGSAAGANPLLGTWKSDRDLTLEEMKKAPSLTDRQREILSGPDFFGRLTITYFLDHLESQHPDGSGSMPYRILRTEDEVVEIETHHPVTDEKAKSQLLVRGDRMYVPVGNLGFHEVFRRVTPPASTP